MGLFVEKNILSTLFLLNYNSNLEKKTNSIILKLLTLIFRTKNKRRFGNIKPCSKNEECEVLLIRGVKSDRCTIRISIFSFCDNCYYKIVVRYVGFPNENHDQVCLLILCLRKLVVIFFFNSNVLFQWIVFFAWYVYLLTMKFHPISQTFPLQNFLFYVLEMIIVGNGGQWVNP